METLNQLVRLYLDKNGISDKFFQQYIDVPRLHAVNGSRVKEN